MNRIDFIHNARDCWIHRLQGWGAILTRKGEQPVIISAESKEALIK